MSLFATWLVGSDGLISSVFFLDGIEITETEYWAIQVAAMDRAINEGV